MAEIILATSKNKKTAAGKSISQRSTRVDLTPMVDLGFLLITFFVFTTSMTQPKAMNLIEPIDGDAMPVPQSGAMTIILDKNHEVYYYYKMLDEKSGSVQLQKTNISDIRSLIMRKKRQTNINDLMFIIKSTGTSTYGDNINLLDEMSICDIPPGHYAEADLTHVESTIIESIK